MSPRLRVLVVEDEALSREVLASLLKDHDTRFFPDSAALLESGAADADLLLLDLCSPGDPTGEGTVSRLGALRARSPELEIVVQSGLSEAPVMRACIRAGATRFVLKDHLADEIPVLLERLLELREQKRRLEREILGGSQVMRRLRRELLELRLENSMDALVEGETGSGKELCARALHADGPFIAVNVSAVPAELFEAEFFGAEKGAYTGAHQARVGYFEAAGAGTLFLDEIQSLPLAQQSKLLRVLETRAFTRVGSNQERAFRARVVSASNRNLRELVQKGQFREDLYYRIAPLTVAVPPLRVRSEDVAALANAFLAESDSSRRVKFTEEGLAVMREDYDWPGNVRELRAFVRGLAVKSPMPLLDAPEIREALRLQAESFGGARTPASAGGEGSFEADPLLGFDENVLRFEAHLLAETLRKLPSGEAREKLKLSRSRFYEKIKQFGLGR
jgi:DNA-binding NtrC family response regulator